MIYLDFDKIPLLPVPWPFSAERTGERLPVKDTSFAYFLENKLAPRMPAKRAAVRNAVLSQFGPEIPARVKSPTVGNIINAAAAAQEYEAKVHPQVNYAAREILAARYGAYLANGGDPNLPIEQFAQIQPVEVAVEKPAESPPVDFEDGQTLYFNEDEARRKVAAALETPNQNLGLGA